MSQQGLDLRSFMQIVRRYKVLVGVVVVLGVLGGGAYAVFKPPMLSSTALIALPTSASQQSAATTTGGTDPFTATQEVVADSYEVLSGALRDVRPAMSLTGLRQNVQVGSPSPDIISVTAQGRKAAGAEASANAVANSYISYVGSSRSAVGRVNAHLLALASSATGPKPVERIVLYALVSGLTAVLIGVIIALAIGRNDRRLRERDEIAKSIGIPVLASVPVAHPSAAAGWTKVLKDYRPAAVHAWQLRTALRQLGIARSGSGRSAYDGNGSSLYDRDSGYSSLLVLSLSSDSGALALGPQLAVFAASQGIPTSLVIGPQQDEAATATLRTACAARMSEGPGRYGNLRLVSYEEGDTDIRPDTALVIVVAVVDGRAPEMPSTMRTNAAVLGVSAGAATAEQLARAAVVASVDDREITGILVADPEPADETTGRIPHLPGPAWRRLPYRLRGVVMEIRR
jgi:capsular polysaccharide biosynthesis protein